MKRKNFDFLLLFFFGSLCFIFSACDTESNTEDPDLNYFVKYYGSDGNQYGVDMAVMPDGSFLLLGNYAQSNVDSDIYLLRVDEIGDILWESRIGGNPAANEIWEAKDVEPTNDGNFIILLDFQKVSTAQRDLKLLKISPEGTVLDSVSFGTAANDFSRSVTPLQDGGFIVSGTTEFTSTYGLANVTDPDLGDIFNYRFDQSLNQFSNNDWSPITPGFGGRQDVAVRTVQRGLNEFHVFGYSNIDLLGTNANKRLGLFYFKRNGSGTESNPYFPGNWPDPVQVNYVHPMQGALGDGVLAVGTSQDPSGKSKIFLSRMRSALTFERFEFDILDYEDIDIDRNIRGVSAASSTSGDLGFLILANEVRSTGATNFWLTKVDKTLSLVWSTTFGSEAEDDTGAAVIELPDWKIAILGTMGLADNQFKMALIKVNREGKLLK